MATRKKAVKKRAPRKKRESPFDQKDNRTPPIKLPVLPAGCEPPASTPIPPELGLIPLGRTGIDGRREASAQSQKLQADEWNRNLYYDRFLTNWADWYGVGRHQGMEEPPPPKPPSFDGRFSKSSPHYRLADIDALRTFGMNDREVPIPPEFSYNQRTYPKD